ncbi:MAG: PaaI family thioesterase [Rhizobiaceae bacterium]
MAIPQDADRNQVLEAVRDSFGRQTFMVTLGAQLETVSRGIVVIDFNRNEALLQQHGYLHAGVATSIVDSACGYAALSSAPLGSEVLTIEFKINFLRPMAGDSFRATGRVIKAGKAITVCEGTVTASDRDDAIVATMSATMMILSGNRLQ